MARKPTRTAPDDELLPEPDRIEGFPRPREQEILLGHDAAEREFADAFHSGRLHHAWLIGGAQGIGKATLAYRMARYVFRHPDRFGAGVTDSEGLFVGRDDPVFHRVSALGHADLLVLRRPYDTRQKRLKTVLSVDEIRRTGRFFGQTAGEGGWRICIVDAADELNQSAANALLKILEEPPSRALFFLVSHVPGRLLATLRSRCRTLPLSPLDDGDCMEAVRNALGPDRDVAENDLETAVNLARGSVGRALGLVDSGGIEIHRALSELFSQLPRLDIEKLHRLADRLSAKTAGAEYDLFCELLPERIADMVRSSATSDGGSEMTADAARLIPPGSHGSWAGLHHEISRSIARANGLNLDRKQLILSIFFDIEDTARTSIAAA